jgi:hypothetical protein
MAAAVLNLSLNLNLYLRREDAMATRTRREIIERLGADPAFRARFEEDPAGALQADGYSLNHQDLDALWEGLRDVEGKLGEVLEPRVSKTCLSALVGGVAYEEVFAEDFAQPSSEEAAEAEEYEDPESPRWA